MTKVVKRDGRVEEFNPSAIYNAVFAAAKASEELDQDAHSIAEQCKFKISNKVGSSENVTVEELQDAVEKSLMGSKWKNVAGSYVSYRSERDKVRHNKGKIAELVKSIIDQTDEDILFENANLNSKTLTTQRALITSEVSKVFADELLPEEVLKCHNEGVIQHHDKNFSPLQAYTNCCLVNLKGMLELGTKVGGAAISSPNSIGVATAVTSQVISQVSSSEYGGVSIANIDQVLAPYVTCNINKNKAIAEEYDIKDKELFVENRTRKEIYDAFQALEYEINSLFNSHSQSPFSTISFGMGTSWEEREIQKAILQVRKEGLGEDKVTACFPKLIMFIDEGLNLNKEDPNYDIKRSALECASLRQYPDIISVKNNKIITGASTPVTSMGKL